jgi:hypothetical protein
MKDNFSMSTQDEMFFPVPQINPMLVYFCQLFFQKKNDLAEQTFFFNKVAVKSGAQQLFSLLLAFIRKSSGGVRALIQYFPLSHSPNREGADFSVEILRSDLLIFGSARVSFGRTNFEFIKATA